MFMWVTKIVLRFLLISMLFFSTHSSAHFSIAYTNLFAEKSAALTISDDYVDIISRQVATHCAVGEEFVCVQSDFLCLQFRR
jgi:hypothetical protein